MNRRLELFYGFSFNITPTRLVLLAITVFSILLILYRFYVGLGPPTHLTDFWPWGIWKSFLILPGVPLAAAGFVTIFVVYICNLHDFKPLAKRAVLIGFLGYVTVMFTLLVELGLWYNFWRPFFHWGYTSILFEVIICLTLYCLVLFLEFSPQIFERFNLASIQKIITRTIVFLAGVGIILSFFHQSSLGGLFIIAPYKLHELWYSTWLPWYFFITALIVAPATLTLENYLISRSYKLPFQINLLSRMAKISVIAIVLFLFLRIFELATKGVLGEAISGTLEGNMFLLETGLFFIALFLFGSVKTRNSKAGLLGGAVVLALAIIAHRSNVLLTAFIGALPTIYIPSWMEVVINLGIITFAILVYLFVIENFRVVPGLKISRDRLTGWRYYLDWNTSAKQAK